MSESTVTKSNVFLEDMSLATGGTGAAESGNRKTSTGGTVALTKLDASHIKFRSVAKSLDDMVDGGNDVNIKPNNIDMAGTLTMSAQTAAGFLKNDASGVITGGNQIIDSADALPSGINANKIANGSVSNTEFQYLDGVTSAIQTQLNAKVPAVQGDQETGTEGTKYVTPAVQKFHPSAAKAWVKVVGGGTPTIAVAYNVTSITDSGSGDFVVVFTVAFSSEHYAVLGTSNYKDSAYSAGVSTIDAHPPTAGSCQVVTFNTGAATHIDIDCWYCAFFGDQS